MKPEELHTPAYYRSLTRTMLMTVFLVSFTPLLLISGVTSLLFHSSYHDKVLAQLMEMVQKHQQNIDLFLTEKQADILLLSRSFSVDELMDPDKLRTLLRISQQEFGGVFVDLGLVDGDGLQQAYAGPFLLGQADYSGAEWFKQTMDTGIVISDVFLGLRGTPHFIVAVRLERGGKKWILRSTIDFMAFNSLVQNIRIGRSGSAFIINRQGRYQTGQPGENAPDADIFLRLLPQDKDDIPAAPAPFWKSRVDKSMIRVLEREDRKGGKKIHVITPLKGGQWVLVYQQDMDDAFSSLYQARRVNLVILGLGGLGIVVMAVLLSRRMVNRIRQADREMEVMGDQVIEAGKLASIGELAAGIAHEINNPVAIMVEEAGWVGDLLGDQDNLASDSENWKEIHKALDQIRTQGARCKEITHKLLSFARKIDPTVRQVHINDVVHEVVGLSEQRARYANIELATDLAPDLPGLEASPSELQQVLLNLINNAIDAIGTKGGFVRISTDQDGDALVLSVADSGEGIPKANMARIFDPFFTTKPVGKGTGLGLSIIYGIVKKMGGDITVESEVNVGTTFLVRLPVPPGGTDGPDQGQAA